MLWNFLQVTLQFLNDEKKLVSIVFLHWMHSVVYGFKYNSLTSSDSATLFFRYFCIISSNECCWNIWLYTGCVEMNSINVLILWIHPHPSTLENSEFIRVSNIFRDPNLLLHSIQDWMTQNHLKFLVAFFYVWLRNSLMLICWLITVY